MMVISGWDTTGRCDLGVRHWQWFRSSRSSRRARTNPLRRRPRLQARQSSRRHRRRFRRSRHPSRRCHQVGRHHQRSPCIADDRGQLDRAPGPRHRPESAAALHWDPTDTFLERSLIATIPSAGVTATRLTAFDSFAAARPGALTARPWSTTPMTWETWSRRPMPRTSTRSASMGRCSARSRPRPIRLVPDRWPTLGPGRRPDLGDDLAARRGDPQPR